MNGTSEPLLKLWQHDLLKLLDHVRSLREVFKVSRVHKVQQFAEPPSDLFFYIFLWKCLFTPAFGVNSTEIAPSFWSG